MAGIRLGAGETQPATQLESPKVLRKGVDNSGAEQVVETQLTTTKIKKNLFGVPLEERSKLLLGVPQEFPCQGTEQGWL